MQKALVLTLALLSPTVILAQQVQSIASQEVVEAMPQNITAPQLVTTVPQQQVVTVPAQNTQPAQQVNVVYRTQPLTVVEDTPLRESKAEQLRKSRIEVEQATENRIVEKLEEERMKAERERAEKLLLSLEGKKEEPVVTVQPVAPVVQQPVTPFQYPALSQPIQVAPTQIVSEPAPIVSSDVLKEEFKEEKKEEAKFYVTGMGGFADYPGVSNIKGMYAAGFTAGMAFPERVLVEGGAIFSKYKLEEVPAYYTGTLLPVIKDMNQMNLLGAVKYQILDGRIRPVVGLIGGYTKRTYSDRQYFVYQSNEITSHAFDMGLSGGVDVKLTDNFGVSADLRYMFNISYDVDSPYEMSFANPTNGRPTPEELDYYLFSVGARLQF